MAKLAWPAGIAAIAALAISFVPNDKLHLPVRLETPAAEGRPAATPVSLPPLAVTSGNAASLADLVERVTPAVVNVAVKSSVSAEAEANPLFQDPAFRRFFGVPDQRPRQQRAAAGSGVIVDADKGYVITNHHVVDKASEIAVTLKDRREFKAKIIGSDKETDIALLQIEAKGLTALPIGDSSAMRVGDFVVAIGNPFGLGQTVTSGIVSAMGRSGLNIEGYEDFIQTDAAINPGNSGGALVNLRGELIGINTAIVGPSGGNVGVGFAVPTSMARGVMDQLAKHGKIARGRIGVEIQDLTAALAENLGLKDVRGAIVRQVEKGAPADNAGVKAGDVVVAVNNAPITGSASLRNRMGLVPPGETVTLSVLREGAQKEIRVKVETVPDTTTVAEAAAAPRLEGAAFETSDRGVRVSNVERNSPAWQAGLRPGDVIVAVNRKPAHSVSAFKAELQRAGSQAALFIERDGEQIVLVV